MTLLHNQTLSLRALEPTDLDWLYDLENDTALWLPTNTPAPFSRQILYDYLQQYTGDIYTTRQLRLAIEITADNTPVGTVDLFDLDPLNNRAEAGLYISPEHRGKGYGQAAIQLLCEYAERHLGLAQVYAFIATGNAACLAAFEACGFTRAGVLRHWIVRGPDRYDAAVVQRVF